MVTLQMNEIDEQCMQTRALLEKERKAVIDAKRVQMTEVSAARAEMKVSSELSSYSDRV